MIIESKANPKFKHWIELMKHRSRHPSGEFMIEGKREVSRALQAKVEITTVVFSKKASQQLYFNGLWSSWIDSNRAYILSDELFQKLSLREHPDGVLAVAKKWGCDLTQLKLNPQGLYLLAEGLEKPGNLGALMRTAEATNVDGFFIADPRVDIFNPNVIRASQGAVFTLNAYWGTSQQWYTLLKDVGLKLLATTPHTNQTYWECNMTQGCVICVGSEAHGLSPLWMEMAEKICIPMYGTSADSLNANISGTLCLYEARRQRHQRGLC